jgi:hypothetical protein
VLVFCAPLTLHVSAPIGGHLQVVCNTKNSKAVTVYVNGSVASVENTLNILHFINKDPQMNSLERFYIYRLSKDNLYLNDTYTDISNPIYNLVTEYYKQIHMHYHPIPPHLTFSFTQQSICIHLHFIFYILWHVDC